MRDKNPDMVAGEKKKFVMRPPQVTISPKNNFLERTHFEEEQTLPMSIFVELLPQVVRVGSKKTAFANFSEIAKMLHRQPKVWSFAVSIFLILFTIFYLLISAFARLPLC